MTTVNRITTSALFTILLAVSGIAHAENWSQFRGPEHQGNSTETSVPLYWSSTSNVVWKTEIPGESWSSPVTWGTNVFVTTATDNGQTCRVLSVNAETGAILWNKEFFRQVPRRKEGRNSYASPTPATDGKRVYACFGDGSFAALNFAGDVVWTNRDYPFYGQHGLGTSPILFGDLLIMARDGSSDGEDKKLGWQKPWDQSYLLALDIKTGKERWKGMRGLSRISHGAPNVWDNDGRPQIITEAGDVLQGFDPKSGERLWSSEVIGEGKVPSVVVGNGLAFTSGGWGGKETIKAFRMGGHGDLKETNLVWEQRKGMSKIPSMSFVAPYLFAISDGGIAICMRAETGELIWQERVGGNYSASPVYAEGRLYLLSDEGLTTVISAGPEFKVLAKNPLNEKVQASIAVSNHRLFIRTEKNLYCIGEPSNKPGTAAGASGLLGSWSFDESGGAIVKDTSGNGHHGRLLGASRTIGKYGGAIECKQDELVEVPHTTLLDEMKQGMSICAWVNRTAHSAWNMIFSREIKEGPSEYFGLAIVKDKSLFSIDPDGTHYKNIKSDEEMPVGEWIHMAGTYDNESFKLFVNGRLVKSAQCSERFRFADQNPLIIGGNSNTQGKKWVDCFHGRIDEVQLYQRALSEREILELYQSNPEHR